jgi:hypothetical protein
LVFDDFDQLYTQIIYTELIEQDESEESEEASKYDFKIPDTNGYTKIAPSTIPENNQTIELVDYITDIDYRTIVAIQKLTADVYAYEEEAKSDIQKISNTFRRDGCLKEIKEDYKKAMEIVKTTSGTSQICIQRLNGVEFSVKFVSVR